VHAGQKDGTGLAVLPGMRWLTAAGLLVFSTGSALGGYVVELDGGDRMTVDSYWEDGERTHLVRGGVDMSVPRGRVRSVKETTTERDAPAVRSEPRGGSVHAGGDQSRRELERQQVRIDRHLVRTNVRISQARARGESPEKLRRLQKEIDRTAERQRATKRALASD
jgi:hypothetical protein